MGYFPDEPGKGSRKLFEDMYGLGADGQSRSTGAQPATTSELWTPELFGDHRSSTATVGGEEFINIKYSELPTSKPPACDPRQTQKAGIKEFKPLADGRLKAAIMTLISRCTGNVAHCGDFSDENWEALDDDTAAKSEAAREAVDHPAGVVGQVSWVTSFGRSDNGRAQIQDPDYNWTSKGLVVGKDRPGVCVKNCKDLGGFYWQGFTTNGGGKGGGGPHARDDIRLILVNSDTQGDISPADPRCIRIVDKSGTMRLGDWQNSKLTPTVEFVPYNTPSLSVTSGRIHPDDIEKSCQPKVNAVLRDVRDFVNGYGRSVIPGHVRLRLVEKPQNDKKRPMEPDQDHKGGEPQAKRPHTENTARGGPTVYHGQETQDKKTPQAKPREPVDDLIKRLPDPPNKMRANIAGAPDSAGKCDSIRSQATTVATKNSTTTYTGSSFNRQQQNGSRGAYDSSRGGPTTHGVQFSQSGSALGAQAPSEAMPRPDLMRLQTRGQAGQYPGSGVPVGGWKSDGGRGKRGDSGEKQGSRRGSDKYDGGQGVWQYGGGHGGRQYGGGNGGRQYGGGNGSGRAR
ncbi:hypothetical protein TI39_contig4245g00002 [Zymoseptoria brevis]|uniref:Uncharacterized protein n=1 Tax=Zymoseptoria brevis TaxID=1047168 RepID=A0A0F4GCB9_9PEZI|nr:hypothetical protein TI39_contig4245g00002 [Zymoseptoria brevis]